MTVIPGSARVAAEYVATLPAEEQDQLREREAAGELWIVPQADMRVGDGPGAKRSGRTSLTRLRRRDICRLRCRLRCPPRYRDRVTEPEAAALAATVAAEFVRAWSSMTVIEGPRVATELERARPTLTQPGGDAWFLEVQRYRLTVHTMMSIRSNLVPDWGVPLTHAAAVWRSLVLVADLANSNVLEATLDAAAAGGNPLHAFTEAVVGQERSVRERAAGFVAHALQGDPEGDRLRRAIPAAAEEAEEAADAELDVDPATISHPNWADSEVVSVRLSRPTLDRLSRVAAEVGREPADVIRSAVVRMLGVDYAAMAQSYKDHPPRRSEMVGEPSIAPSAMRDRKD